MKKEGRFMLKAKIHTPHMNKNIVSRDELYPKLDQAVQTKLTLVTAPAGYGKTTAVLDWLRGSPLKSAWLSLDAQDNEPMTFWQYVCAALDVIADGISRDTEYVFSSPELLDAHIHINILIDRLTEADRDILLVLDDLHVITDPAIMTGLSYLIDYLPQNMHLLIISRTEPAFKLARHKLKWQIQHVTEADLRFTRGDISRFYETRGLALLDNDLEKIDDFTEGWAAAMVAVAMSMESGGVVADAVNHLAVSSRDVSEYLVDEVISAWEPSKREFAMKISVLNTMSEASCNAVTGKQKTGALLEEISRRNGFLFVLDAQAGEYRFHNLFRTLLYKMLEQEIPGEIPGLYKKAAQFFMERGQIPDAIEYYLNGGLHHDAFLLIEHKIDHLIQKNDFGRLLNWIDRLPQEYRDNSFKIAVIYSVYYAEIGKYKQSRQWFSRMKELQHDYPYASGPEWRQYADSMCMRVEANLCVREGNVETALSLLSGIEADAGKHEKMLEYQDFNMTDIFLYRSPISVLTRIVEKVPEYFRVMAVNYRILITKNPGYAPLVAGEFLYETNRVSEAHPYILAAMDEARTALCPGALVPAMVYLARIKHAALDIEGAFSTLDECEKLLRQIGKPHWLYLLRAFRCRLYLDTGYIDEALAWYDGSKTSPTKELNRITEFELIVTARVLMAQEKTKDADALLQKLLKFTSDNSRTHSHVEILNLLALNSFADRRTEAFKYMDEALDIGLREGYVRSFIDEIAPMERLLKAYALSRRKAEDPAAQKQRRAFALKLAHQIREYIVRAAEINSETAATTVSKNFERLTEQEKKVLELMVKAAANKDIAEKLGIGLRTVKMHTGNIYGKLGLKNRAQVVKIVRDLGLL
jgi:LuxR family maltose regulon positive regulatory protein